ncbi:MAG: hypothetical protein Wins2KO_22520 [Winogradskyella sp.]
MELQELWQSEQTPIRKRDSLMKIYGVDSEQVIEQQHFYEKNHINNEKLVTECLDLYGWPKQDEVGEQGILTICNVIQYSSFEVRSKYLSMMKQAVRDKQLEARLLARAEDRLATDKNQLQIYGTQIKYYPDSKSFNVWPIKNPKKVDSLRAEIGLGPIAEFLGSPRFSIDWNMENQIKRSIQFEDTKDLRKTSF